MTFIYLFIYFEGGIPGFHDLCINPYHSIACVTQLASNEGSPTKYESENHKEQFQDCWGCYLISEQISQRSYSWHQFIDGKMLKMTHIQ